MDDDINYNYSNIYSEEDDNEIFFKVYIKECELFLKDFQMKPNFLPKKLSNFSDFKKILSITKAIPISPIEVYYKMKYDSFNKISDEEEKCSICLDLIYEFDKNCDFSKINEIHNNLNRNYKACLLNGCQDHFFHVECLNNMIGPNNFVKCPNCSKIYGKLTGTQPPGTMKSYILKGTKCEGYNCDTICIEYYFPDGKGFTGTQRNAFLPYNNDGLKILGLLKEAFDRKLIFTVGTSVTTGRTNTTVWAGIHHKTSLSGGTNCFGFPDPTYFTRVQEELSCKGVTEDSMSVPAETLGRKFLSKEVVNDDSNSNIFSSVKRFYKNVFPSKKKK